LRKFRAEHPEIRPEDIKKMVVHTTSITRKCSVDADDIKSVVSAQLSHPYVCAVTLMEGNAFIDQFTEDKIKDPKILEFARKVEVVDDPEIENLPRALRYTVKIDIHLNDGRVFNLEVNYPKGHPKNPFTKEELLWKFKTLGFKAIQDDKKLDRIAEALFNLEEVKNVRSFVELLRKE